MEMLRHLQTSYWKQPQAVDPTGEDSGERLMQNRHLASQKPAENMGVCQLPPGCLEGKFREESQKVCFQEKYLVFCSCQSFHLEQLFSKHGLRTSGFPSKVSENLSDGLKHQSYLIIMLGYYLPLLLLFFPKYTMEFSKGFITYDITIN